VRLLLDTHALLWWLGDDPRLGPAARIRIADAGTEVLVSVVSLWEIVVKVRLGKLEARIEEVEAAIDADGFLRLPITPRHLSALRDLPAHHRDPFDHLLIAQAIAEGAAFVTADRGAPAYGAEVLACEG
jgi:PIN domain nuclease of toxin-antitoxin system